MKKILLVSIVLLMSVAAVEAQTYWHLVKFTSKTGGEYTLDNPQEFMSQRAIDRRSQQQIEFNETDLPIKNAYVEEVAALGYEVRNRLKWLNTIIVTSDSDDISTLSSLDFVESVTLMNTPSWSETQKKAFFDKEKHNVDVINSKAITEITEIDYGQADNQIKMLNGQVLHDNGYTGDGMVIAVLDAGFKEADQMTVFEPLFANNQVLSAVNLVRPEGTIYASSNHYHGTAVLSTMAANVPGEMVGTAPDAHYHLIITEDQHAETLLEEYFWIDGAEYADSVGADIINSSLGYTEFDFDEDSHVWEEDMDGDTNPSAIGADMAAAKGILVVTSAGNSGNDSWYYISSPADADSVMTVGAVDAYGSSAGFSSHGPTADGRVKPDVVAQGQGTTYAYPDGNTGYIAQGNGTSFSSPVMAGMMACFWQANSDKTNMEILQAVVESADMINNPDANYGFGLPDFEEAMQAFFVDEVTKESNLFEVYPNPVNDDLNLYYKGYKAFDVKISVYTQTGLEVFKTNTELTSGFNLTINDLDAGIYFVNVSNEDLNETVKVVVVK
jgi:hypothetical protein